jgi:membrane fusion protein (multidrug efflux system)
MGEQTGMPELDKPALTRSAGLPVADNQNALAAGHDFPVAQGKSGGGTRPAARLKKAALALAIVAGVFGAAYYGRYYWTTDRYLVTTDDAYVAAHWVMISPRVPGYISEVLVDDNQSVKTGQAIVRLDPRDYQVALDQARASVAAAQAVIDTLTQQIDQQKLAVDQARQAVAAGQAAFTYSRQNFKRYTQLAHKGYGPVQLAQQSTANIRETQAALARDTMAVSVAQKQVDIYEAQLARAQAELAQQQASERQAALNLGYTEIKAPFDGTVGARTVQVGENVQPGTQLMALVPLQAVYISANYMETQLTNVHPGQPVTIRVDTYPDAVVHGRVESLAPASGQEFALLPPDNATGNFTKIVQRIPVKIEIDRSDPLAGRLRPGMSVEPTIDTKPVR